MQTEIQNYLENLGVAATADQASMIARYTTLLWQTNERVNLTRHLDLPTFLSRDVRDSVAIAEHLEHSEAILDVGSGGGIPGILLAILRPDLTVALAESISKKATALEHFVHSLGIDVTVHNSRAEQVVAKHSFDVLTVRAVGSVAKLCELFRDQWGRFNRLLALKGRNWTAEVDSASESLRQAKVIATHIADYASHGGESTSSILCLARRTSTPPD